MQRYLTEFIGAFFLILTVCLTAGQTPLAPIAIGGMLMVMVYMGGHISGGHFNPAVTLAVVLRGKCPAADLVPYWAAQIVGGLAAAALAHHALGEIFGGPAPGQRGDAPVPLLTALLIEIVFTFALALVVLNAATARKTEGNSFYGLAIGFTVVCGALAGGGISGGAFNPAVGTGPIVYKALMGGGLASHLWVYWVGPLLGGALAAVVFRIQEGGDAR